MTPRYRCSRTPATTPTNGGPPLLREVIRMHVTKPLATEVAGYKGARPASAGSTRDRGHCDQGRSPRAIRRPLLLSGRILLSLAALAVTLLWPRASGADVLSHKT